MSDNNSSNPPRVAIKFGKPSSSSSTKKHAHRPANIRRHRAHALDDDESSGSSGSEDERDTSRHHGRHEVITDLDWSTTNQDDDDKNRRRKHHHHHHNDRSDKHDRRDRGREDDDRSRDDRESRRRNDDNAGDRVKREGKGEGQAPKQPVKFGLTINSKRGGGSGSRSGSGERRDSSRDARGSRSNHKTNGDKNSQHPKNLDDEAMDALLGNDRPPKRRAPSDDPNRSPEPEDYQAVPIDDFGATLLKSLGWDGKMRGKVKEATPRHANLAGLGMKDAKGAEELSSWNQKVGGGGKKDSRPPRLEDYAKEERKKRQRIEEKYGNSYKREREQERERERERGWHR